MSQLLARKRKAAGFTQHQLSRAAGIPRWKIAYAEGGHVKLTPEEIARVEQVFAKRAQELSAMLSATA